MRFFLLLLLVGPLHAQPFFIKHYGPTTYTGNAIVELESRHFVVAGTTSGASDNQGALYRLNADGYLLWMQTYGSAGLNDSFDDLVATSEPALVAVGYSVPQGPFPGGGAYVVKTDLDGVVQWEKHITQGFDAHFNTIIETSDGHLLLGGSAAGQSGDFLLVKMTFGGEVLWQKFWGTAAGEEIYDLVELPDGGFAFAGYSTPFVSEVKGLVGAVTADGTPLWTTTIDGISAGPNVRFHSLVVAPDDDLLAAGVVRASSTASTDTSALLVTRLGSDGAVQWTMLPTLPDYFSAAYTAVALPDGDFVLGGMRQSTTAASYSDAYLIRIDGEGTLLWERTFPVDDPQSATAGTVVYDLLRTRIGDNFVLTGSWRDQASVDELLVIRTDEAGIVGTGTPAWAPASMKVAPNPLIGNRLEINISGLEGRHDVELCTVDGRRKTLATTVFTEDKAVLEVPDLAPGVYMVLVKRAGSVWGRACLVKF